MFKPLEFIFTAFLLFRVTFQDLTPGPECGNSAGNNDRTVKISLNSRRNQTGEWVDTFIARTESSNSTDHLHLDVTHRVTECDGKRVVYIKGVTKDAKVEIKEEKIKFHPRCGKNVAIGNKGFTVQKINVEDPFNSAAFTDRPLRNNEIFEVLLDKRITKFSYGLGIGVTTISPADVEILTEMYKSTNAWMYHGVSIYSNGNQYLKYNRSKNVDQLQVGDRVGVMRNEFGALHFFVNGVDQGPAMSNVPETVYGVFELRYNDVKATIVDANNSSSL